ncbi:pathogenesis-related protein pr10, partial [Trifolium pratense]
MGVFTFEQETTSTVAPAKLYKAVVHDADDIIVKAVDEIKSVEIVE